MRMNLDSNAFPKKHLIVISNPLSGDQEGWFGKFKFEEAGDRIRGTYHLTDKGYIDDYENFGEHKVLAGVK